MSMEWIKDCNQEALKTALAFWLCYTNHEKFVQFQKEIPEFASLPKWPTQ